MKKVTWQRIGAAALAVLVWQAASMAVGAALLVLVAALVFSAVVHSQLAYYYATPYYR